MPALTLIIVFGSWLVILIAVLAVTLGRSTERERGEDPR